MRKKMSRWLIVLIIMCAAVVVNTDRAEAANTNEWYNDYTYYLTEQSDGAQDNYINLTSYKRKSKEVKVPATAVIGGKTYRTALAPTDTGIWYKARKQLTKITFEKGVTFSSDISAKLFYRLEKLTSVNVEVLDMSKITNTAWMFAKCSSLVKLNVKNWNVGKVTNMFNMFGECTSLTTLDVSRWNTSAVTEMTSVFDHCESLYKINVNNWDVSNVKSIDAMFYLCQGIESLDLHSWNTRSLTSMSGTFGRCYNLKSINLKGWKTSKVKKMEGLFCCDYSLQSIDLGSFDMSKVKVTSGDDSMFIRCSSLKTIRTPKKLKKNIQIASQLTYRIVGKNESYNCIPVTTKSLKMICTNSAMETTGLTSVRTSGGKIELSWEPIETDTWGIGTQYEVQCSASKKFNTLTGSLSGGVDIGMTHSVQDHVVDSNSTTITKLKKGKTYYVRVRAIGNSRLISKWSAVRKIKVK